MKTLNSVVYIVALDVVHAPRSGVFVTKVKGGANEVSHIILQSLIICPSIKI